MEVFNGRRPIIYLRGVLLMVHELRLMVGGEEKVFDVQYVQDWILWKDVEDEKMPDPDKLNNLASDLLEVAVKYEGCKRSTIMLDQIADAARKVCADYVSSGVIRGFTLNVNGVAASHRVSTWPADAWERTKNHDFEIHVRVPGHSDIWATAGLKDCKAQSVEVIDPESPA